MDTRKIFFYVAGIGILLAFIGSEMNVKSKWNPGLIGFGLFIIGILGIMFIPSQEVKSIQTEVK